MRPCAVEGITIHAKVAHEAGEEFKRTHPDDPRSEDQLGAVHLYSQGWAEAEKSLYAVLNATLSTADRARCSSCGSSSSSSS